ncbi:MAG: glycosyltransferase family 2 protein [Desulfobacteraceae bacterium]|jgi:cellulose synthase/poly-beta-1,6-N-acetylglucosamine synthase-like glycosyltransferase|nr:MAG: glycosyltransferase family 2 protein [Desulfobacteraceae bacterium]
MEFIFWFSIVSIIYAYIGYPVVLAVLAVFRRKTVRRDHTYCPPLSLIITVHNEQVRVLEKIQNTLSLKYPREKLEIIFASDASTDKTEEIIQAYPRLKLVRSPERKGKEFAQKCAVEQAAGEILVFSDVATIIDPEGLKNIAANFADPTVGCVSSEDRFIDEQGRVSGEGAYVKYEMLLRRLESKVYSLVGLSGSFFAARREVCAGWAVDLQSDFNTLLNSMKLGLRGISDPNSLGWYRNIADEKKEFNRKVRTVVRGLSVLTRNLRFFNPSQYGLFSWQLFSHKLCRWLVPFFLVTALVSNVFLLQYSVLYIYLFGLQIAFYLLAGVHLVFESKNSLPPLLKSLKIPYYFLVVNAAVFMAWIKFFQGERSVYWEPSKR